MVTDGRGATSHFVYDGLNRVTVQTEQNGQSTLFTYDGMNKIGRRDALGHETIYGYDARNRLWSTTYTGAAAQSLDYAYDLRGQSHP